MKKSTESLPGPILIVTRYFPPAKGGTEAYSYQLARGLTEIGEKITVIAPQVPGWEDFDRDQNFSIVRFPGEENRITRIWQMYLTTRRLLKSNRIGTMLATTWSPAGVVTRLLGRRNRIPYFVIAHGTELYAHRFWNYLRGRVFASAAGLIANSDFTCRRLQRLGVNPSRISIIHPAIDIQSFRESTEMGNGADLPGRTTLLTVTRLTPKKGVDMVLRVMPEVKARVKDLHYIIVGQGEDRGRLEGITRDLNITDMVRFAGRVSDAELIDYYRQSDLFVLVSREEEGGADYEGFGIVFLEAAACGKPVVGGRSGGIPEAVEDGVTGILVDPLKEEDISRAILSVLTDGSLARKLGEAGRSRVEKKFSYIAQAQAFREILR